MITYRLAIENDYNNIVVFYNRVNKTNRTIKEFCWLFNDGPFGKAVYVLAEDGEKIIGTNCVIPFHFILNGKIIKTGKSEDTLVDSDYRGQGVFYKIYDVLFEECKKANIEIIWGFTSALKPFKKLGFSIPFHIKQSTAVGNVFKGYTFFTNKNSSFTQKSKYLGFVIASKAKNYLKSKSKLSHYKIIENEDITNEIDEIIASYFSSNKNHFAILQNSDFQNWRVYDNPYYKEIKTFGFYDHTVKLMALIVVNINSKVGYVIQSTFHKAVTQKDKSEMIKYTTSKLFKKGVTLVKNWVFDNNDVNESELNAYNDAGHIITNNGMGFVWKNLSDNTYDPNKFIVSKISSQGTI
ncbi:hypothetical protein ULMA_22740 [Patiriisocius marinus]|uniref:N-acetyltransferase domain-containing protein n=1 Tax=Patiriisocius marinus TaxID=1397112 RepID=A0A5J4IYX4_9FLAO|nr:GNAT family N-acetyltransferase [Patiriisocius marinus]GER60166.1 hypothetical protein ULMA_22740 [Patiriisocius marinus]